MKSTTSVIFPSAILSFLLLLSTPGLLGLATASAQSSNLTVATQDISGTNLTGYWVVVQSGSSVVTSGFSPTAFTLSPGTYQVGVGDYGGEYFNHWIDGTATRFHTVTIGSSGSTSLTAIYCPAAGCGGSSISVSSVYADGSTLNGMYTVLSQNGHTVATGFTPVSFPVTGSQTYSLTVSDYTNAYFNHWSDGNTVRTETVTATGSTIALSAIYTTTQGGGGGGNGYSITVTSTDLNGAALSGFFFDVRVNGNHVQSGYTPVTFNNLTPGVQYQVIAYGFGNHYFRHYSDGQLNRYELVTLSSGTPTVNLNAMYELVPSAQAASLNVMAEFPNGTIIGQTFNNSGYIQHTPGMWLTVTPPGSSTPYTGTFTGGSLLPFILFSSQTYVVTMSTGYKNVQFSHWQETGSTNPARSITLSGSTTVVAIYVQTS